MSRNVLEHPALTAPPLPDALVHRWRSHKGISSIPAFRQTFRMKNLTSTICLAVALLLGSAGVSWSQDWQKGLSAYRSGDFATALREWTPLAKQGNAAAQYNLGLMYANGRGISQDYKTAVKWYRLAAEQGNAVAQFNLGMMYKEGKGVPQDYKTAAMNARAFCARRAFKQTKAYMMSPVIKQR